MSEKLINKESDFLRSYFNFYKKIFAQVKSTAFIKKSWWKVSNTHTHIYWLTIDIKLCLSLSSEEKLPLYFMSWASSEEINHKNQSIHTASAEKEQSRVDKKWIHSCWNNLAGHHGNVICIGAILVCLFIYSLTNGVIFFLWITNSLFLPNVLSWHKNSTMKYTLH